MQTTLIISMAAIFLTWLYIQQKRLAAYERYCMDAYRKDRLMFICDGCKLSVWNDYCLKTVGFCYLCDPNIPLEDLLDPNITVEDIQNSIENQPTVSK